MWRNPEPVPPKQNTPSTSPNTFPPPTSSPYPTTSPSCTDGKDATRPHDYQYPPLTSQPNAPLHYYDSSGGGDTGYIPKFPSPSPSPPTVSSEQFDFPLDGEFEFHSFL
jgi:hypothetical protein